MDWNRVEGNWKQVKGKVKEHGGSSPTMILMLSAAAVTSWKARSRSGMATPKTRSGATWTIGTRAKTGDF